MTDSTPKAGRPRKVDVQVLRRKLLSTCDRYLTETPLDQLSASMIKSIADVLNTVGPEFAKEDRAATVPKRHRALDLPFPVGDDGVDVPSGSVPTPSTANPDGGFPAVPVPSIEADGGIKSANATRRGQA